MQVPKISRVGDEQTDRQTDATRQMHLRHSPLTLSVGDKKYLSKSALVGAIGKRIIKISLSMSFVQRVIQAVLVLNFQIRKGETLFP